MAPQDLSAAMTKRSLRTVRAELEFLADSAVITSAQYNAILAQLPPDSTSSNDRATNGITNGVSNLSLANSAPTHHSTTSNNTNGYPNEKADFYNPPAQSQPPPSYGAPSSMPPIASVPLTHATALYAYNASDAGDLNLAANDRVAVTEYMNADWWKGRNERTGLEGIFPRSYVKVEEKAVAPSSYGNMPLDVASASVSGSSSAPGQPNKVQEGGKKFGKKLGNAAIFGAGATIGGNIVNSIF